MVIIVYCQAVLVFCVAFYFTKLVATCNQIIAIAQTAVKTIASKTLDDNAKEKATQEAAVSMLKCTFLLVTKLAVVLGLTVAPILLADSFELAGIEETSEFSLRLDVLLITTAVVTAVVCLWRKISSNR
jgi:hypothetical protein